MSTAWDPSDVSGGIHFPNAPDYTTFYATGGYGQMVLCDGAALTDGQFVAITYTGGYDIDVGFSQKPFNANTDPGGANSGSGYGDAWSWSLQNNQMIGPTDYTLSQFGAAGGAITLGHTVGLGFKVVSGTPTAYWFKDGVQFATQALSAGNWWFAASDYNNQHITIDGNPASVPSGFTARDSAGGAVDGNASGSTITVNDSVVSGAATGSASKAGVTITETVSVISGTATGSASKAGAIVTVTSSVATSGAATGTATASGAVIPVTTSVIAGAAHATNPDASVPGVTISLAVSIISGAASGRSRDTGGSGNKKAGRARPHHASIITEEEHRQRQHDAALVLLLAA